MNRAGFVSNDYAIHRFIFVSWLLFVCSVGWLKAEAQAPRTEAVVGVLYVGEMARIETPHGALNIDDYYLLHDTDRISTGQTKASIIRTKVNQDTVILASDTKATVSYKQGRASLTINAGTIIYNGNPASAPNEFELNGVSLTTGMALMAVIDPKNDQSIVFAIRPHSNQPLSAWSQVSDELMVLNLSTNTVLSADQASRKVFSVGIGKISNSLKKLKENPLIFRDNVRDGGPT